MFNIFNKKISEVKKLRKEFEKKTKIIRSSNEDTQIAVGHSINIVNSYFIDAFSSIDNFISLSIENKYFYIDTLIESEIKCSKSDPNSALGISLFRIWVRVLTESDEVLSERFGEELAYFSRKAISTD